MALSRIKYPGDSSTDLYTVPFPYISKAYVKVRVGGTLLTDGVGYNWQGTSAIRLTAGNLPSGVILDIRRETPITEKLVDFQDGSLVTEANLDLANDQTIHMGQELTDGLNDRLVLDTDDIFNAVSKRIKNLADPVNPQDAVTRAYGDAHYGGASAIQAGTSATSAQASADAASLSASNAATSATNAANSATAAANSAATFVSVQSATHAATAKATPVDADEFPLVDSAASFGLKKFTWANIKATLKSYFDTLYGPVAITAAGDPTYANNSTTAASTGWIRGAMSAIATAAGFVVNLGPNGYIKFPSWLGSVVVEWGVSTIGATSSSTASVTFPLAFPTGAQVIIPGWQQSGATVAGTSDLLVTSWTKTGFTVSRGNSSNVDAFTGFSWFAIGY